MGFSLIESPTSRVEPKCVALGASLTGYVQHTPFEGLNSAKQKKLVVQARNLVGNQLPFYCYFDKY